MSTHDPFRRSARLEFANAYGQVPSQHPDVDRVGSDGDDAAAVRAGRCIAQHDGEDRGSGWPNRWVVGDDEDDATPVRCLLDRRLQLQMTPGLQPTPPDLPAQGFAGGGVQWQ